MLSHGNTTTRPYNNRQDENVMRCLAMRMDPTWSINAAADYGNANLKVLERSGFKLGPLNGMERAKMMYLMHHEGEGAGPLFVRNNLLKGRGGEEALQAKFELQMGSNGAAKVKQLVDAADGDVSAAYRYWFAGFVDKQFAQSGKYFFGEVVSAGTLSKLLVAVGGVKIEEI